MPLAAFQRKPSRWAALLLVLSLVFAGTGCNAVLLLGYLIGGPPSREGDFNTQTKKDLAGKGKTVLILCYAGDEINNMDFEPVDRSLAKYIAAQFMVNKIKVVDPDRVMQWVETHPDYEKPADVGAAFKADYVVHVDMLKFDLYEENTQEMYRGRSDYTVSVIEMQGKKGKTIYSKSKASRYPTRAPVSVTAYTREYFKKLYLTYLSNEIGMLFYPTFSGDDIPHSVIQ